MNTQQIITQVDALLSEVERARRASPYDDLSGGLADDDLMKVRTRLMAAIERLAPHGSSYLTTARAVKGHNGHMVLELGGILGALRSDFQDGYIHTIEELVHGVVFDDFLEMASELLTKGYKDPAAVIAGTVLEEHIRKLAVRNSLGILDTKNKPKSFDTLAIELVKAQHFSEPQRKILAGWYGQRNEAAHGQYANVIESEVGRMIDGIRDFMVRFPA